jgi:hypothetical protein
MRRALVLGSILLTLGCAGRAGRAPTADGGAANPAAAARRAPSRVACTAYVSSFKSTRVELELRARAGGGYDLTVKHTNGLGCNFEGRLEQLQCSFHEAQPLAFECRRDKPLDPQSPTLARVTFVQMDYRRVEDGVSTSGQRIEADLFQSPRIADRPIACHRLGDESSLSIAFAQSGCVVDGDATP